MSGLFAALYQGNPRTPSFLRRLVTMAAGLSACQVVLADCDCGGRTDIYTRGSIPYLEVEGLNKGPDSKITVEIPPEGEPVFTLSSTGALLSGCHSGRVVFGCGFEFQTMSGSSPSGWQKGSVINIIVEDGQMKPGSFRLRRSKGESTSPQNPISGLGSSPGGSQIPGTESPPAIETAGGQSSSVPAGLRISVPLGDVAVGSGGGAPYRSAGVLTWSGPITDTLSKPVHVAYNGSEEVKGRDASVWGPALPAKVTFNTVSGFPEERHLVTPSRFFRVTGYNQNPATTATFSTAPNTYIREYVRNSSSETPATTFANAPVSWWTVSAVTSGVKIEQSFEGVQNSRTYVAASASSLVVMEGDQQTEVLVAPPTSVGGPYVEQTLVSRSGIPVSKVWRTFESSADGYRIQEQLVFPNPSGSTGESTFYSYYPVGSASADKLWWVSNPDGSWEVHEYPSSGDSVRYTPFASEVVLNPSSTNPNVLPLVAASGVSSPRVRKTIYPTAGVEKEYVVSLAAASYEYGVLVREGSNSPEIPVANVASDVITDGIPLMGTNRRIFYSRAIDFTSPYRWLAGKDILSHEESGKAEFFEYSKAGDVITITKTTGIARNPVEEETATVGAMLFETVPSVSERVIEIYGPLGLTSRETLCHTGSAFTRAKLENIFYSGKRYHRTEINGVEVHRVDRPDALTTVEKDEEGRVTTSKFDAQGELLWTESSAGGGVPAIRTSYQIQGRTRTTRINGVVAEIVTVDGLGRDISRRDAGGAETVTSYLNGGRDRKAVLPGGVEQIEERYLDGTLKARSGNGWIAEFQSMDVAAPAAGFSVTRSTGSATSHTARRTTEYYDQKGRIVRTLKPSPAPGGGWIEQNHMYSLGMPAAIWTSELNADLDWVRDLPQQLLFASQYLDEELPVVRLGSDQTIGYDFSGDGVLDFGSGDRFTKRQASYTLVNGVVYRRTVDHRYPETSGANPLTTETLESVGFIKVGQDSYNAVTKITEPSGRSLTRARLVTPASATVVTTEDDSATIATTDKTTTENNGYIQTVEHAGIAVNETFAYDSFGRIKRYSDARNAATYSYYDYNFRLAKVTNQLRQDTLYQYYQSHEANAGQIKSITRADQGVEETTYTSLGQISGVSGSGAYPRTFGYDIFGDKITMTTYGTQTSVTRWTYDPATGLLASKRQNDGGSESTGWDYEYTLEGEIAKRTSTGGVVTAYDYNETTGDLTGIGYTGESNRTPDVAFSNFDGFGRPRQVTETKTGTDPHTNTQTLSYERYSGATTVNYASTHRWLKDVKVRQYADDAAGRPAGFEVLVGSTMLSNQSYHYDDRSRLDRVSSPDLQSAISYLPASDKIQGVSVTRAGNVVHSRSLSIDMLGRVVGVDNKAGATTAALATIASVGHAYDTAGRQDTARREDGTWWDYEYNSRSEVTGAVKRTPSNAAVPSLSFAYGYDDIGNRTISSSGTGSGIATRTFVPNALNQYESATHPGKFSILSRSDAAVTAAAPGATVSGVDQEGNLYGTRVTVANGTTGKQVSTTQYRAGVSAGTIGTWVPAATTAPDYDDDGNLVQDGRWTYTWDGENRLISMVPTANALTGGAPNIEVYFSYDWQGRRIGKAVVDKRNTPAVTTRASHAYDQWNPVAEWSPSAYNATLNSTNLQRTHLWGPDIGSSGVARFGIAPDYQAAGGVNGLIASTKHNASSAKDHFFPSYDAIGNIIAWSDGGGVLIQRMDYDPFGNAVLVEKLGTAAAVAKLPAFAYSTKQQESESGLYYYGYRFYDPSTGRWLNPDPIQEDGGLNLLAFVQNSPTNLFDVLGRNPGGFPGYYIHPSHLPDMTRPPTEAPAPMANNGFSIADFYNKIYQYEELELFKFSGPLNPKPIPMGAAQVNITVDTTGKIKCCEEADGGSGMMFEGDTSITIEIAIGTILKAGKTPTILKKVSSSAGIRPKCESNATVSVSLEAFFETQLVYMNGTATGNIGSCSVPGGCSWDFKKSKITVKMSDIGIGAKAGLKGKGSLGKFKYHLPI